VNLIKRNQQNKTVIKQNRKSQTRISKRKMPIFNCACGTNILIIPDLAEMNRAIKNHVIKHKKLTGLKLTEEHFTEEILKVVIRAINET
jgi:hypothetical protein